MFLSIFSSNWADPLRPAWGPDLESYKEAFNLFGTISVAWYAIMILSAIILSVVIGYFGFAKRLGVTSDHLFEGVILGVVAGIVGARLWYVVADIFQYGTNSAYIQDTLFASVKNILNISEGGLAISGGVLLAGIALFFYCRYRHIKVLYLLEIVLPLIMISQVLGRWGNFFNFEAHGGLINVPGLAEALESSSKLPDNILQAQRDFLWFFPDFMVDRMYIFDEVTNAWGYCHPCFFYEGALNFIGFTTYMLLRRFVKKGIYVGDGISFYLVWYGIVRFFVEQIRTDAQMLGDTGIRVVVVYAAIMVIAGIAWLIIRRVKKISMITCYDALYGYDSTIFIDQDQINKKKNKKQKNNITVEAEV